MNGGGDDKGKPVLRPFARRAAPLYISCAMLLLFWVCAEAGWISNARPAGMVGWIFAFYVFSSTGIIQNLNARLTVLEEALEEKKEAANNEPPILQPPDNETL